MRENENGIVEKEHRSLRHLRQRRLSVINFGWLRHFEMPKKICRSGPAMLEPAEIIQPHQSRHDSHTVI